MPSPRHDEITARFAASKGRVAAIGAGGLSGPGKQAAIADEQATVAKDIARYKARECHNDLASRVPLVIPLGGGRSATILTAETLPNDDAVKITVSVMQDAADVTPKGLNPWIIANPPMLVADPLGDVSISSEDHEGNITVEKYREDPAANIVDLVRRKLS